jgi:hypothetical protein
MAQWRLSPKLKPGLGMGCNLIFNELLIHESGQKTLRGL